MNKASIRAVVTLAAFALMASIGMAQQHPPAAQQPSAAQQQPAPETSADPNTWAIDPNHTSAQFAVRHMMVSTVRGKLGKVNGTVKYDGHDQARSWSTPRSTYRA